MLEIDVTPNAHGRVFGTTLSILWMLMDAFSERQFQSCGCSWTRFRNDTFNPVDAHGRVFGTTLSNLWMLVDAFSERHYIILPKPLDATSGRVQWQTLHNMGPEHVPQHEPLVELIAQSCWKLMYVGN